MKPQKSREQVPTYCALCISRCGATAVLEEGRFVALKPDPTHPTGKALCAKGRAAPELVYHPDRLLYPLKRTRPKGDPDPGWQRISWEEALDLTAANLRRLARESGPECVVFNIVSPSTSASADAEDWIWRFVRIFGSPNVCVSVDMCGWVRYLALIYTYGASVPGHYLPDIEHAGCILYWGYNPNTARLAHSVSTLAALKRGARLIVVDPRRAGLAKKADAWLQVRPGSDGALALGIARVMITRGWFDEPFIREWTNGPLLVRGDNGRFLRAADLEDGGSGQEYLAWDRINERPMLYDAARVRYEGDSADLAIFGSFTVKTRQGEVVCRPAFDLTAELCSRYTPRRVEAICGVDVEKIESAARLLWESRPVAYYVWSGLEQQSNATQIARAIGQLYALTGSFDERGGNVKFPAVPTADISGNEHLSEEQRARALGLVERPLGPGRFLHVTGEEIYRAILEQEPYAVRGLVGVGGNLLLSHADSRRGREALQALDFYVHMDLFMNPSAELADVVLPVASAFEREGLKIGFDVSVEAQSLVQLRPPVIEARGAARSDMAIFFDLAGRLGLGEHFWEGDIDAAYRYQLGPSGLTPERLRRNPGGIRVPLQARYRKFAEPQNGRPAGFNTPTRKIEFYSETLLEHGYPPLPDYEEPLVSPYSQPELAERFPLILTCAKHPLYCESQFRALPSLRRMAPEPEVELHPLAAEERGIEPGDWVSIETPSGRVRARARLSEGLQPNVVCGQHGWWEACAELGAPGYDPFSADGANLNLIVSAAAVDPVGGSVPHRAYLCQVRRLDE
ncbi:MAG: molybdopterin-dependent oxidoreductase [Candidatus Promineifilaceae bacterium]|nr:molybdopterin-dependent oxidoreductase [Candidatus Promineifilaceae bacterium]